MTYRWNILVGLIKKHGLKFGAEIGVKRGQNIEQILKLCPDFKVIAVDVWDDKFKYQAWKPEDQLKFEGQFQRVIDLYPDNIIKKKGWSMDMAKEVEDLSLDLIFIDADHSYRGCKSDIEAWLPKLKHGGFMAGHDYKDKNFPGVEQAVKEFFGELPLESDHVWVYRKP